MTPPVDKPLSGVTIRNIRSQASCACGWKGPWRWRRRMARADVEAHDAAHGLNDRLWTALAEAHGVDPGVPHEPPCGVCDLLAEEGHDRV